MSFGSAHGIQVKFFETNSMVKLEQVVNQFLQSHYQKGTTILDIKYLSDKEEYGKHFTSMIVFRED